MSSVGNRTVYEAGDQRTVPDSEKNKAERFKEGKKHSHQPNDSSTYTSPDKISVHVEQWNLETDM
jgi:hypothetical protein